MEIGITVNNAIELCAVCQGISSCYKLIIIIYTGSTDSQFKMVDVSIFKEKLIVWLTMLISSISKFLSKLLHVCKFNLHLIIDMQTFCTILTIQQNTMIQLIKKKKKQQNTMIPAFTETCSVWLCRLSAQNTYQSINKNLRAHHSMHYMHQQVEKLQKFTESNILSISILIVRHYFFVNSLHQ